MAIIDCITRWALTSLRKRILKPLLRLTCDSRAMAKIAGPPVCAKDSAKVQNQWLPKSQILLTLLLFLLLILLVKILHSDNSILIVDNKVPLKWSNCVYPLGRSTVQRLTECQYKQICKHTPTWPLDSILISMGSTYPAYHVGWTYEQYVLHLSCDAIVAQFVTEGRTGLSCCTRCALIISWWSWWTQSQGKWKKAQFKVVEVLTDAEQQVGNPSH